MKWTERQLRQDNTVDFLEAITEALVERAQEQEDAQRIAINRKN